MEALAYLTVFLGLPLLIAAAVFGIARVLRIPGRRWKR